MFGLSANELAFLALVVFATVSGLVGLLLPLAQSGGAEARLRGMGAARGPVGNGQSETGRLIGGRRDDRRKQLQDTLRQIDERAENKSGVSLRLQISRAGLTLSLTKFWIFSLAFGLLLGFVPLLLGFAWYVGVLAAIAGALGLPRWFLSNLAKRRQKAFIENLADAIDVMVRGLKAGLPLSDAMRVIAAESSPPIGPEFTEVVDGQRVGVTIDQGFERMYERIPLPEVSFLGIVISIQSKAGGNLSEALANLSRILRDRKKLKAKVRAMSQEAKSSAAIIGSMPFFIVGALLFMSPDYLQPLLATSSGHMILGAAGAWMLCGIIVMRKMIDFDI